ncbi:MAG: hypothetical protein IAE84_16990 [Saprospiraceae bacterium]|jgi:hypothetical protein|nr:hypothetical protein [Saprospiraceae bacterium]
MTQGISFIISDLLAKAQLQEAAATIQEFLKDKNRPDLDDQITMVIMQLNKLANDYYVLQILSEEDARKTHNELGFSLLNITKEVKALEKEWQQQQANMRDPAIESLVYAHMHAMLEKDIDGIMKTFHPDMPGREQTQETYLQIFQQIDALPEVRAIRLLSKTDEMAGAEVVQFTRNAIEGVPFRENETTQIYLFRKAGGLWKIYNTIVKKIEYFDFTE